MFSCQIKTSVFPHLIRFLGKLVKLKLKTSCNKTMNSVHFMPRDYILMTITSSKQCCSLADGSLEIQAQRKRETTFSWKFW